MLGTSASGVEGETYGRADDKAGAGGFLLDATAHTANIPHHCDLLQRTAPLIATCTACRLDKSPMIRIANK